MSTPEKRFEANVTNLASPEDVRELMDVLEANGYEVSFLASIGRIDVYPEPSSPDDDRGGGEINVNVEGTTIERDDSGDGDRVDSTVNVKCEQCGNRYQPSFTRCPECGQPNPDS